MEKQSEERKRTKGNNEVWGWERITLVPDDLLRRWSWHRSEQLWGSDERANQRIAMCGWGSG